MSDDMSVEVYEYVGHLSYLLMLGGGRLGLPSDVEAAFSEEFRRRNYAKRIFDAIEDLLAPIIADALQTALKGDKTEEKAAQPALKDSPQPEELPSIQEVSFTANDYEKRERE